MHIMSDDLKDRVIKLEVQMEQLSKDVHSAHESMRKLNDKLDDIAKELNVSITKLQVTVTKLVAYATAAIAVANSAAQYLMK